MQMITIRRTETAASRGRYVAEMPVAMLAGVKRSATYGFAYDRYCRHSAEGCLLSQRDTKRVLLIWRGDLQENLMMADKVR